MDRILALQMLHDENDELGLEFAPSCTSCYDHSCGAQ